MPIIAATPDEERQLMRKEAQQAHDKNHARRLIAMLMLHQGMTVTNVARLLCAARSSVGRWINWITLHGVEGLKSLRPGRAPRWPVADNLQLLPLLVQRSPKDFGWLRSRWSTELLALVVNRLFDLTLHRSTLHRHLRGSLRHADQKIPRTIRREADTIAVELRQRLLMLTQGTELPVMQCRQRRTVFHFPDRIPLRCVTNVLISGILLRQVEQTERFRHPAFQLFPDGTAAASAGELLPGFREFAGQCLTMYRGDRLFRPPLGELGPDRFRQALPDAVLHGQRRQNVIVGDINNPFHERQAQYLHLFHGLLGQRHAPDVQIVQLSGGGIINMFRWHESLRSEKKIFHYLKIRKKKIIYNFLIL